MVTTEPGTTTESLAAVEQEFHRARCAGDAARLAGMLVDDFVAVHFLGFAESRTEFLAGVETGVHRPSEIRTVDRRSDVLGAVAATTGRIELTDASSARRGTQLLEQSIVWVAESGRWQAAWCQQTRSDEAPTGWAANLPGRPGTATAMTEDRVRAREDELYAAMVAADVAALRGLLAADLRYVNPTGEAWSRETVLDAVRDGRFRHRGVWPLARQIHIGAGGAASTGVTDFACTPAGARPFSLRVEYVHVWRQDEDALVLVARQATRQPL